MRILVTGGAGFIGSHVADAYIKKGHKVVIVDNMFMGNRKNINPEAKFYKKDIRAGAMASIIKKERIDVINHHAAQISVPDSVKEPLFDADINIRGTINMLEAARKNRVKKFIFISSGGTVYGAAAKLPAVETMKITADSPYGISKVAGEHYVRFYTAQYGIEHTILRYSNVYGPRQVPHGEAGVVAIFIKKMLEGSRPVIFGGGRCIRDYVYAGDAAEANVKALTRGRNSAFNIGTGIKTDVNRLYSVICGVTGYDRPALKAPFRQGDLAANYLNIKKAAEELGWKPKTGLKQGIEETYLFFKSKK